MALDHNRRLSRIRLPKRDLAPVHRWSRDSDRNRPFDLHHQLRLRSWGTGAIEQYASTSKLRGCLRLSARPSRRPSATSLPAPAMVPRCRAEPKTGEQQQGDQAGFMHQSSFVRSGRVRRLARNRCAANRAWKPARRETRVDSAPRNATATERALSRASRSTCRTGFRPGRPRVARCRWWWSSAGFIRSYQRTHAAGVGDHLHQLRLAVVRSRWHRGADAGRDRRSRSSTSKLTCGGCSRPRRCSASSIARFIPISSM